MKVEFIGTYEKHEIRKTSKDKDYVFLTCKQAGDNRQVSILLFNNKSRKNILRTCDYQDILSLKIGLDNF